MASRSDTVSNRTRAALLLALGLAAALAAFARWSEFDPFWNEPAIAFRLTEPRMVSVGIRDAAGRLIDQPVTGREFGPGRHRIALPPGKLSPGRYRWSVVAYPPPTIDPIATVAAGMGGPEIYGGEAGPPCAVAAEGERVFLGWRMAERGHEIVACNVAGDVLWGHHHGPAASGVWDLAADGDHLFVLGGAEGLPAEGGVLYRLDAATGAVKPWDGGDRVELSIASLWVQDGTVKPLRADYLAADNGRLYLTFQEQGFIAVLDAATGAYVTTLTGPAPGRMALSTTPMTDPSKPGAMKTVDFGIAAIAGNGLAYFIMEHEPPWVMLSITRWLQRGDRIAALAMRGDTMRSSDIAVFTALGAPHHYIQLRPADAVEGFTATIGEPGGRPSDGPWNPAALQDIRALTVDAEGKLWVAECDGKFGRFTVWQLKEKAWSLRREILGPVRTGDFAIQSGRPLSPILGGQRWTLDVEKRRAVPGPSRGGWDYIEGIRHELTGAGLVLWSGTGRPGPENAEWTVNDGLPGGGAVLWVFGFGGRAYTLRGPDQAREITGGECFVRATR
jgi:hypothetical protein